MNHVEIVEVSPRDGLQNEAVDVSTEDKVELIRRAVAAGIRRIEVASFVSPKRVPRMADAEAVCERLTGLNAVKIGLVLNRRGALRALGANIDELGSVVSATDGFGVANQGRTSEETIEDAIEILGLARNAGRRAQVTISVAFGCPFDGEVPPERVADIARHLAGAGLGEIALGDTIGVAAPGQVIRVIRAVRNAVPSIPIRCHFHDTRNTGIANAWAATREGAVILDSSIGGLGGCPFAPGATGNIATEDLLYMLHRSGVQSGIELPEIIETSRWFGGPMGRILRSATPGQSERSPSTMHD